MAVENSSTVDCRIVAKSSGIAFDLLAASRLRLVGCSISSVSSKGSVVGELDCVHKGWRHQEHDCSLFPSRVVTNPLQIVSREPSTQPLTLGTYDASFRLVIGFTSPLRSKRPVSKTTELQFQSVFELTNNNRIGQQQGDICASGTSGSFKFMIAVEIGDGFTESAS